VIYSIYMSAIFKEFAEFLKEYKTVSLAIAFVMGSASTALVNSLVKDVVMPIFSPLLSNGSWKDLVFHFGPVNIAFGSFIAELLNFLILALIIFLVAHKIFKLDHPEKKSKNIPSHGDTGR
jgi:large conductance mechanosensitive channel